MPVTIHWFTTQLVHTPARRGHKVTIPKGFSVHTHAYDFAFPQQKEEKLQNLNTYILLYANDANRHHADAFPLSESFAKVLKFIYSNAFKLPCIYLPLLAAWVDRRIGKLPVDA